MTGRATENATQTTIQIWNEIASSFPWTSSSAYRDAFSRLSCGFRLRDAGGLRAVDRAIENVIWIVCDRAWICEICGRAAWSSRYFLLRLPFRVRSFCV